MTIARRTLLMTALGAGSALAVGRQFAAAAPGDPAESVDDPHLFMAAAFEEIVDAYEAHEAWPR